MPFCFCVASYGKAIDKNVITFMDSQRNEKFKFAKSLINSGDIKTVDQLYNVLSKKFIADVLNLNVNSFSNKKSNTPGEFKLAEIIKLATALEVDVIVLFEIFTNSIIK